MEPEFRHVGTVEILRSRIYNIDPNVDSALATEVIVEPGAYPLLHNGFSYMWMMTGKLNGQFLRRGDGMSVVTKGANAVPTNLVVTFPSKFFGPNEWQELIDHPTAQEGHPEQRIRISIPQGELT